MKYLKLIPAAQEKKQNIYLQKRKESSIKHFILRHLLLNSTKKNFYCLKKNVSSFHSEDYQGR